jgi:hypothetical protein
VWQVAEAIAHVFEKDAGWGDAGAIADAMAAELSWYDPRRTGELVRVGASAAELPSAELRTAELRTAELRTVKRGKLTEPRGSADALKAVIDARALYAVNEEDE